MLPPGGLTPSGQCEYRETERQRERQRGRVEECCLLGVLLLVVNVSTERQRCTEIIIQSESNREAETETQRKKH